MKNALIALATIATLGAAAPALASNNSFSSGNGEVFNAVPGTLFGGSSVDFEATASIGNGDVASGVQTETTFINGREADIRYTLNADGTKDILSKSYTSSSN